MQVLISVLLVIIGVLLFGFVIFFHELGHFLLAKAAGIRVNEFAIGMGPKLFSLCRGETQYALRLLPIGGFCAMEGEDETSDDASAFGNKPVWRRILVVAAGGIFNIVLGVVLMVILLAPNKQFATTTISQFAEDSRLQAAGAQVGDRIVEIDGYAIYTDRDLSFALALANPEQVSMVVEREGGRLDLGSFAMDTRVMEDGKKITALDFFVVPEKSTPLVVLSRACKDTFSMARMVVESLKGLLTGRFGLNEVAGPVGTAQAISQAAGEGLAQGFGQAVKNIVMMMILITVNLGIVNLLPLPALDGGRLLFLVWEGLTRRPVPVKYEGYVHAVGFVLLIGLMVLITFHDIIKIVTG